MKFLKIVTVNLNFFKRFIFKLKKLYLYPCPLRYCSGRFCFEYCSINNRYYVKYDSFYLKFNSNFELEICSISDLKEERLYVKEIKDYKELVLIHGENLNKKSSLYLYQNYYNQSISQKIIE